MRGHISTRLQLAVYRRDGWVCQYCGATDAEAYHLDHVIPVAKGGTNVLANLVVACLPCNTSKHDRVWLPTNLDVLTEGAPELRARIVSLSREPNQPAKTREPNRVRWLIDDMLRLRGVTAQQLCAATGLATSTVSELRTNRAQRFDLSTLDTLLTYFDCRVDDLLILVD